MDISNENLLKLKSTKYGLEVFGKIENYRTWLNRENFFFDWKKPMEFLSSEEGEKFVESRLFGLMYGDNA